MRGGALHVHKKTDTDYEQRLQRDSMCESEGGRWGFTEHLLREASEGGTSWRC